MSVDEPYLALGAKIGQGSYGKVYSAKFSDNPTPVAIKVITIEFLSLDYDLCPAVRELLVGSISPIRRGIVQFNHDKGHQFGIVTDIGAGTLRYCTSPPIHAIRLFGRSVLEQLSILHDRGIMHRDVKPDNIIMRFDENKELRGVDLIDFGLSTAQEACSDKDICSLWWRAPEILLELSHTKAADVWSFGVILADFCSYVPLTTSTTVENVLIDLWTKLGKHHKADWPEMYSAPGYTEKLDNQSFIYPPQGLRIKRSHRDIIPILSLCLQQNHDKRSTIAQVLAHPFWKEEPSLEDSLCAKQWFKSVNLTLTSTSPLPTTSRNFESCDLAGKCFTRAIPGLPSPVLPPEYLREFSVTEEILTQLSQQAEAASVNEARTRVLLAAASPGTLKSLEEEAALASKERLDAKAKKAMAKAVLKYGEHAMPFIQDTLSSWKEGIALHIASAIYLAGCLHDDFPLSTTVLAYLLNTTPIKIFKGIVKLMELYCFNIPSSKKPVIKK